MVISLNSISLVAIQHIYEWWQWQTLLVVYLTVIPLLSSFMAGSTLHYRG